MKVNNTNSTSAQASEASAAQAKSKSAEAKAVEPKSVREARDARRAGAAEGTKAEISDRGREVAGAKSLAVSAPDVREEKVAELKRRIAAGQYKTDANAIADKMVSEHLDTAGMG